MRLIDADALMESLYDELGEGEVLYRIPPNAVDSAPTIEATPVVHGRWMLETGMDNSNGGYTRYCDRCHDYYTTEADSLYFCPRCSAKMIGIEQPKKFGWKMDFVDGKWERVWDVTQERFVKLRTKEDFPVYGAKMDGDGHG